MKKPDPISGIIIGGGGCQPEDGDCHYPEGLDGCYPTSVVHDPDDGRCYPSV